MDAAGTAIGKLFGKDASSTDTTTDSTTAAPVVGEETPVATANSTTVDTADQRVEPVLEQKAVTKEEKVAPAIEKETIKREHETQEETVIDKERHQDHYHTTVQPLQDREVLPTQHDTEVEPTEVKKIDHDDAGVKDKVDAQNNDFQSSTQEGKTFETTTKGETVQGETVHHHLHETIQPVIEKETVQPSVTQKVKPVTEIHQDESKDHGITEKAPMSVDDFKRRLDGEATKEEVVVDGSRADGAEAPTL